MGKYRFTQMHRRLGIITDGAEDYVKSEIRAAGEDIAKRMKDNLQKNGSVDTGALQASCRSEYTEPAGGCRARVYADAKSEGGELYAEFLEYGTGVYNEHGDGRKTPWHWQDREGQWHTTTGYEAKPFIRPAVKAVVPALRKKLKAGGFISKNNRGK